VDAPEVPYPTTYAGDLPCADCPGQRLTVTFFADGSWRLRRTFRSVEKGQDRSVYEIGVREKLEGDKSRITLRGVGDPLQLRAVAGDRLQLLDRQGNVIASKTNDLLALQATVDTISGPVPLRGLYTYLADAASFQECLTGKTFPILPVAGSSALQSAYLAARHKPGAPVFASLTGLFVDRSPEPGSPVREHLIVTQYERVAPDETCGPPGVR
jgi:copper homeostasis protein (lipoprotein)